ncbi:MAG: helicase DnaB [Synechococcaceae cyanobacterium]|nr:helicase DnaB [Synechococcaceae cyanobacterium]
MRGSPTALRPASAVLAAALLGLGCLSAADSWRSRSSTVVTDPDLIGSVPAGGDPAHGSTSEGQRPDPLDFSPEELRELNRRFGVHGPQPRLAQLFTRGLDQLQPLRSHTLTRVEQLRPVILGECERHRVNPMLVTAVLFDELQHAKPGEDLPLAAHSGLFSTHGPAQLSVGEMVKQGLLDENAGPAEVAEARSQLLDPDRNVQVLVGKFARLKKDLGLPTGRPLVASRSPRDAKGLATLAYLHNGKLDYPGRILRYMQDPELHALLYGARNRSTSPLI